MPKISKHIWEHPIDEKSLDQSQTPLWFWNDELNENELLRQLEMQTAAGVRSTAPHARSGYIGGYMTDDWFQHIRTVMEYKKQHDEPMWIYDEYNWPAGTCNRTITLAEKYREEYLEIREIQIPAGEKFRTQVQNIYGGFLFGLSTGDPKALGQVNVAVVDRESGKAYPIEDYLSFIGGIPQFEFQADRDAIAYMIKVQCNAYRPRGSSELSYINPEATDAFITSTYEKYYAHFPEYFGSTLKCMFNDETRLCHALVWSRDFSAEFQRRKGYDITPKLYQLIRPGIEAGRVRCDYFDVLASLYQENYFGRLQKWCHDHGIDFYAHLLGEETLVGQARYSGDYMRQNRYQDQVGSDHPGKGIGSLNVKFTACAAHSYGKDTTAIEMFAGSGWDLTFEEYIRMVTWAFQQGMKIVCNHGFFYSDRENRRNDWPPSQFFQWQGWDRMKEANAMTRRLHYALTGGHFESEILVYNPMETFWLHYQPDQNFTHGYYNGPLTKGPEAAKLDRNLQLLLNGLLSENLDFDMIHKDAVENFQAESQHIVNRLNGQRFSVLVLPMCQVLPIEMAWLCRDFIACGGTILALDTMPEFAMPAHCDEELQNIFQELQASPRFIQMESANLAKIFVTLRDLIHLPVEIVKGTAKTINNHPVYPDYLIDPYMHGGEDITGVMLTRYLRDEYRHTLVTNYGSQPETVEIRVESSEQPQVFDTFTGAIYSPEILERADNHYLIRLELPCNYGIIIVGKCPQA